MPSKFTSIVRCLLNSEGKHGPDTFAPIVGSSFDSCQEAYEQYNLVAWENGFGIRHGMSKWGDGRYQLMHEIVCQCQVTFYTVTVLIFCQCFVIYVSSLTIIPSNAKM